MAEQATALTEAVMVGYRFARRHTFDPHQVSSFARLAGDDNPIHHDEEFASGTRFRAPIVSGTHTTAPDQIGIDAIGQGNPPSPPGAGWSAIPAAHSRAAGNLTRAE